MDYQQVLAYLDANWHKTSLSAPVKSYPFDRLRALLARLGSPERQLECVGVTGSKGKGSIAKLTAEILRAHGLRVGMFSSPHLVRVEERVELDGQSLAPELFARRFGEALEVQRAAGLEDLAVTPLLLALALAWFRDESADVAVLEVRAGGRFDPTNVAPSRTVCIGPIGLEHVPGLGYALADIAWQKAGLLKPGAACFAARQPPEAELVLERECETLDVRLFRLGQELDFRVQDRSELGQSIDLRTPNATFTRLPLSLLGDHQAANASLAAGAAEAVLRRRGRALEAPLLSRALAAVRWPGRLERLSEDPLVLYDGAHTPESAAALARALADHFPARRWSLVVGILPGKHARAILEQLHPVAARVRCVPVPGFRHQPAERLAELSRSVGLDAAANPTLLAALENLADLPEPICVTGTLYLYAATLEALSPSRSR
jgi:dihydrofolate synthase/folylpolyglutamate synthase